MWAPKCWRMWALKINEGLVLKFWGLTCNLWNLRVCGDMTFALGTIPFNWFVSWLRPLTSYSSIPVLFLSSRFSGMECVSIPLVYSHCLTMIKTVLLSLLLCLSLLLLLFSMSTTALFLTLASIAYWFARQCLILVVSNFTAQSSGSLWGCYSLSPPVADPSLPHINLPSET